jgi:hypothetical protein
MEKVQFLNPNVDSIKMNFFGGGGALTVDMDPMPFNAATIPSGVNITSKDLLFYDSDAQLNEFGYIYISLHMIGNFARYYPDIWMRAVEESHQIALVIERSLEIVQERMPLAALSELSRSYHVVLDQT